MSTKEKKADGQSTLLITKNKTTKLNRFIKALYNIYFKNISKYFLKRILMLFSKINMNPIPSYYLSIDVQIVKIKLTVTKLSLYLLVTINRTALISVPTRFLAVHM